jgi:hypothetical protein
MMDGLAGILTGTAGLGAVGIVALVLTLARGDVVARTSELRAAARLAAAMVVLQAAHFAEEAATGFHQRFPASFGLAPWPLGFFVPFNLVWIVVWILSVRGVMARRRSAVFALWFLGLAGITNGVAHPLLALRARAYFPGLATAPLVGMLGVLLCRRLRQITDAGTAPPVGA